MPGELSDPTQLYPYHYDRRYEPGKNPFPALWPDIKSRVQDIAREITGKSLDDMDMARVIEHLEYTGFIHRNWGDESFRDKVEQYIKKLNTAKKVAKKWLI